MLMQTLERALTLAVVAFAAVAMLLSLSQLRGIFALASSKAEVEPCDGLARLIVLGTFEIAVDKGVVVRVAWSLPEVSGLALEAR